MPLRKILLFFAITLAIAFLLLGVDTSLRRPHQHGMALTLIAADRWYAEGVTSFAATPVVTMDKPGDRFVKSPGVRLFDSHGRGYYTSAPPLAVWIPYLLSIVVSEPPSPSIFVLLSFTQYALASFILWRFFCGFLSSTLTTAAMVGVLLHPTMLLYLGGMWSWDTVWLVPWFSLLLSLSQGRSRTFVDGLLAFLCCYGHFAGVVHVVALAVWERKKRFNSIIIGVLTGLALTLLSYLTLFEIREWSGSLLVQGLGRLRGDFFTHLLKNSLVTPLPLVVLLGLILRLSRSVDTEAKEVFFRFFWPTALASLILLPWIAHHPYAFLGWIPLLGIGIGAYGERFSEKVQGRLPILILGLVLLLSPQFLLGISKSKIDYPQVGEALAEKSVPSKMIVIESSLPLWAPLSYFSQRSFLWVRDTPEQREDAQLFQFSIDGGLRLTSENH